MIIVQLFGGLGNQMFQYALGRHLAEKNSSILKLDLSGFETYKLHRYGLHCFKTWEHIATIDEINAFKRRNTSHYTRFISSIGMRWRRGVHKKFDIYQNAASIKEKEFSFDPSVLEAKGNIYLEGYWQSEKYFNEIKGILLRELSFKYEQDAINMELSEQIQKTESVSIHIRRGDYVTNPVTNQVHGLCSLDYYKNSVNYITNKIPDCHFYVFSDDIPWVRTSFNLDYPVTMVDCNDDSTNYEDLRLMSLCRHNIIANSSFSWWGAWLNPNPDKIVVSPEEWFKDSTKDAKDLIPESWMKIKG